MIYHMVEIDARDMDVRFSDGDGLDREPSCPAPNPMGFFRYPATMSKAEAFKRLKKVMVDSVTADIKRRQAFVSELRGVKLPKRFKSKK